VIGLTENFWTLGVSLFSIGLLTLQGTSTLIFLSRLIRGAFRHPPLISQDSHPNNLATVSILLPTLNEAERIAPCLQGLSQQSYEVREIICIDSRSQDGTREKIEEISSKDPRFRLITDDPLPQGWVGRPWALHNGFLASSPQSEWILGIDADTQPQKGLVASLLKIAQEKDYDLITLSPQFILKYPGEWWLQPALLMTLLYRFDSAGVGALSPERVMANGQCFFCRRQVLQALEGYSSAAHSFCDDVTLARNIAKQGYKVGFLDGAKIFKVRMYEGMRETWEEWGRSLDLKDASTKTQLWGDIGILALTQGLIMPILLILSLFWELGYQFITLQAAIALNLLLIFIRFALLFAIYPSYNHQTRDSKGSWLFWLSPFADIFAVYRIYLSASQRPKQWRGRVYH
jgi:dolichol-phosphate mannosyltransferase